MFLRLVAPSWNTYRYLLSFLSPCTATGISPVWPMAMQEGSLTLGFILCWKAMLQTTFPIFCCQLLKDVAGKASLMHTLSLMQRKGCLLSTEKTFTIHPSEVQRPETQFGVKSMPLIYRDIWEWCLSVEPYWVSSSNTGSFSAHHKTRQNFSTRYKFPWGISPAFSQQKQQSFEHQREHKLQNASPMRMTDKLIRIVFHALKAGTSPVWALLCWFVNRLLPVLLQSC